jgi:hypothetical protein
MHALDDVKCERMMTSYSQGARWCFGNVKLKKMRNFLKLGSAIT